MKTVIVIYHTDIWQSFASHEIIGIATNVDKAIVLARKNQDTVSDVASEDGHIVMYEFELNTNNSEKIFSTEFDNCRDLLLDGSEGGEINHIANMTNRNNIAFGDKVVFKDQKNLHPDLRGGEFCLLGMCDNAFALIEWDRRGEYDFHFYSGDPVKILLKV